MILLRKGPSWTPGESPDLAELQKGHLAHLASLGKSGHAALAGPVEDRADGTLRGIIIMRAASFEEAVALESADPRRQGRALARGSPSAVADEGHAAGADNGEVAYGNPVVTIVQGDEMLFMRPPVRADSGGILSGRSHVRLDFRFRSQPSIEKSPPPLANRNRNTKQ